MSALKAQELQTNTKTKPISFLFSHLSLKMSLQEPQQQQPQQQQLPQPQQQPVLVYPNTVTGEPPSHHSNGSFGTVFIVLAVIIVVSAIACFLGRLCNRRYNKQKPAKQNHNFRPKDNGDIEFGFGKKKVPTGKPSGNGGSRGHRPFENGDNSRGHRPSENGDHHHHNRGEMRPGGDHEGEPRAGA